MINSIKTENNEIRSHLDVVKDHFIKTVQAKEMETASVLEDIKQSSNKTIDTIKYKANELENALKFRIEDCETLLRTRINEEYVKTLGRSIEENIIDSFERKNRRTIEEIQDICGSFGRRQEKFMNESEQALNQLRGDFKIFEKDLDTKATKKGVEKYKGEVSDVHKFFEAQIL